MVVVVVVVVVVSDYIYSDFVLVMVGQALTVDELKEILGEDVPVQMWINDLMSCSIENKLSEYNGWVDLEENYALPPEVGR